MALNIDVGKIKFTWKGTYDAATTYERDDVVYHDGDSWVCVIGPDTYGNAQTVTGTTPSSSATAEWNKMAQGADLGSITGLAANDIVYYDGADFQRLPAGNVGQALIMGSNGLEWGNTVEPGQPIEILTGACDGRTQTVKSGTYTFQNVTGPQSFSTGYSNLNGSVISYTPPAGTTRVKYEFHYKIEDEGLGGISHWRFYLAGTEVIPYFRTYTFSYDNNNQHGEMDVTFQAVIECNAATQEVNYGRLTQWTTPYEMKIMARDYSGSYQMGAHQNTWRDGTSAPSPYNFARPMLTVTAIK